MERCDWFSSLKGATYCMDTGDIKIDEADADTLRMILGWEMQSAKEQIERLTEQRDFYLNALKPRCFLCRLLD